MSAPAPAPDSTRAAAPARPAGAPGRRALTLAVAMAAVGGGTAALSGTQRWAAGTVSSVLNAVPVAVDGGAAAPLATAGGLLGLAAVGALLATRTTGRVLVGLLLVAAGVGTAVAASGFLRDPEGARYTTAGAEGVGVAVVSPGAPGQVHVSAWPWLTCAAAALLLVAGVSTTVRGRRWPALGRRYEPPVESDAGAGADHDPDCGTGRPVPPRREGPSVIWDDLDAGRDPTAAPEHTGGHTGGHTSGDAGPGDGRSGR